MNPKWEEISSALMPKQKSTDRPDLIVRVFRMKLRELLNDICTHNVLGRPLAHVYTIEFQKRGLPHHIFWLFYLHRINPEGHLTTIPDADLTPRLHSIVKVV